MNNVFQLERHEEFTTKLEELFNHLYNSTKEGSANAANEEIKDLLLQTKFQPNKIEEWLLSKDYQIDRVQYFLSLLERKKSQLFYSALTSHNSSYGEFVVNYDWSLKLICGTSELQTIKYPILQLAINSYKHTKPTQKMFDFDKYAVDKFIKVLEALDLSD